MKTAQRNLGILVAKLVVQLNYLPGLLQKLEWFVFEKVLAALSYFANSSLSLLFMAKSISSPCNEIASCGHQQKHVLIQLLSSLLSKMRFVA